MQCSFPVDKTTNLPRHLVDLFISVTTRIGGDEVGNSFSVLGIKCSIQGQKTNIFVDEYTRPPYLNCNLFTSARKTNIFVRVFPP